MFKKKIQLLLIILLINCYLVDVVFSLAPGTEIPEIVDKMEEDPQVLNKVLDKNAEKINADKMKREVLVDMVKKTIGVVKDKKEELQEYKEELEKNNAKLDKSYLAERGKLYDRFIDRLNSFKINLNRESYEKFIDSDEFKNSMKFEKLSNVIRKGSKIKNYLKKALIVFFSVISVGAAAGVGVALVLNVGVVPGIIVAVVVGGLGVVLSYVGVVVGYKLVEKFGKKKSQARSAAGQAMKMMGGYDFAGNLKTELDQKLKKINVWSVNLSKNKENLEFDVKFKGLNLKLNLDVNKHVSEGLLFNGSKVEESAASTKINGKDIDFKYRVDDTGQIVFEVKETSDPEFYKIPTGQWLEIVNLSDAAARDIMWNIVARHKGNNYLECGYDSLTMLLYLKGIRHNDGTPYTVPELRAYFCNKWQQEGKKTWLMHDAMNMSYFCDLLWGKGVKIKEVLTEKKVRSFYVEGDLSKQEEEKKMEGVLARVY